MSEYTPTMDDLVDGYAYCTGIGPVIGERRRAIANRAIAAHDRALREQIARAVEERREHFIAETTLTLGGLPAWTDAYLNGLDDAIDVARGEEQTDE
jgi:hypothetical protein